MNGIGAADEDSVVNVRAILSDHYERSDELIDVHII